MTMESERRPEFCDNCCCCGPGEKASGKASLEDNGDSACDNSRYRGDGGPLPVDRAVCGLFWSWEMSYRRVKQQSSRSHVGFMFSLGGLRGMLTHPSSRRSSGRIDKQQLLSVVFRSLLSGFRGKRRNGQGGVHPFRFNLYGDRTYGSLRLPNRWDFDPFKRSRSDIHIDTVLVRALLSCAKFSSDV